VRFNKIQFVSGLAFLFLIPLYAQTFTIELNENWRFHQTGKEEWHPAEVPGCVHTDLLKNKLIEDPFFGTNEKELQWIDKTDWEYETSFNTGFTLPQKHALLEFKGLDTYADIFLNEEKILSTDNMFREWKIDCKDKLKTGINKLRIVFHSPIKRDLPKLEKLGYALPAINDLSEIGSLGDKKVSVFARKAPYHYGWDWGPRFVTSGIWRSVFLKTWSNAVIEDIQIVQNSLSNQIAALTVFLEINSDLDDYFDLNIRTKDDEFANKKVRLKKGLNKISSSIIIKNPKLWWPNGLGEQNLYSFVASLTYNKTIIDRKETNFGLRTIQVVQEVDSIGRGFYFKVNGNPVFMKGANYIPSDNFLNRVDRSGYKKIIKSAADANMNMLRVWGGGIYENDIFYDLCDQYGILVWQDFMFACSMYPGDENFLENVKHEAIDNVKRLRNHPSIALWCGNNENEDAWAYWRWKDRYTEKQQEEIYATHKEIFYNLIPAAVKEHDGTRFYWPSSPSSDFSVASKKESGDLHYWGVWHGKEPFEEFQNNIGRFVSEYGLQSFPEFQTVKSYTVPEDWDIESEVMAAHQRSGYGNLRIRDYLEMYYNYPKNFESFLYASQVLQAYGIKQAIEAYRRSKPYCWGSLYWQLDDCWPVASWSGMDYFKRWKALHYMAKKAYQPVIISPVQNDEVVLIYLISDLLDPVEAELKVTIIDFGGRELFKESSEINAAANSSAMIKKVNIKEIINNGDENKILLKAEVTNDQFKTENILYFIQPKFLALEKADIKLAVESSDDGYEIILNSDKLAKDLYLSTDEEGFFSDNYFDLLPGEEVNVFFKTLKNIEDFKNKIKITTLFDSY
jgi:beta-mannosidase